MAENNSLSQTTQKTDRDSGPSPELTQESPDGLFVMDKDAFSLPRELSGSYELLSCLKYSEQSCSFLLRDRATKKTVLLKTASDLLLAESLQNETSMLGLIHRQSSPLADTFPVPLLLERHGETLYSIRTYIEGRTLEELCESSYRKPGIAIPRALDYMIALTELLHFMHALTPSLIHRDIKPQNVIVDADGGCHLIDLGISRFFGKSKRSDTLIMGTRMTAPPEQFGYQQTDIRSDLYSLGILLLYCITGEYEPNPLTLSELDPSVRRIIQKATMFDPDKRYQSTQELLPDLLAARYPSLLCAREPARPDRSAAFWKRTALMLLLLCLCLALGLILQHTDTPPGPSVYTEEAHALPSEEEPTFSAPRSAPPGH